MPTSTPPDQQTQASPPQPQSEAPNPTPSEWEAETPGFDQPPAPKTDPFDPETTTTTEAPPPVSPPVDDSGSSTGRPAPSSTTKTIGPSQVFTADPAAFQGLIATGLGVGGMLVDRSLSPHTHAWMPHPAEVDAIAEPLARIAARHTPAVGGGETNDILDGLEAAVAGAGYAIRARTDAVTAAAEEQQAAQNNQGYGPGR